MSPIEQQRSQVDISAAVRRNAGSAGLAAACLIFFGFLNGLFLPTVVDLFTLGNAIFYCTLRIGGVAMAVVTIWSGIGNVRALLADAVASVPIGMLLMASGAMMAIGGGFGLNQFLCLVFGYMFISAGWRNWKAYTHFAGQTGRGAQADYDPGFEQRYEETRTTTTGSSLAGQLLERGERAAAHSEPRASARADAPGHTTPDPAPSLAPPLPSARRPAPPTEAIESPPASPPAPQTASDPPSTDEPEPPPPEGFLASFAKKNPPDKP